MMKIGIKTLLALNILLGLLSAHVNDAFAKEVEVTQEVQQENKLLALLERIQEMRLEMEEKIEELKSEPHTLIELELVGVSDEGQYWYDHSAEYEPCIFVDWGTAEEFGVEDYELGNFEVGIFDEEGWELFGFDRKF